MEVSNDVTNMQNTKPKQSNAQKKSKHRPGAGRGSRCAWDGYTICPALTPVGEDLLCPEPARRAAKLLLYTPATLLAAAIDKLEARERVILSLVYFDELEHDEIARVLALTLSEVFEIRARALAQVEAALQAC